MRALLQRVTKAKVSVGSETVGEIGPGLAVLVGIEIGDSFQDAKYLAEKIVNLRIFPDESSKFNLSLQQVKGDLLVVSQFTLMADARKGRRPSFIAAAPPSEAETLLQEFTRLLKDSGLKVETGRFQEHMLVEIHNDGPVTIMLDSREK
ncbi:MAG: D-tyrosyl-tRNA(Tyr) deacylase [Chloroflexi bacterium]|nr:D-tyrosyl-tRNA(Tyr) deacylase [Chloroflexota bacterium]